MEGKDGWKDRGGQTSLPAERNPSQHEQPQGIRKAKRDGTKSEDDLGNFASLRQYRNVKNYSCMFENSRLSAANNLASPCTANQPILESVRGLPLRTSAKICTMIYANLESQIPSLTIMLKFCVTVARELSKHWHSLHPFEKSISQGPGCEIKRGGGGAEDVLKISGRLSVCLSECRFDGRTEKLFQSERNIRTSLSPPHINNQHLSVC